MKNRNFTRILSIVLSLVMVVTMLPMGIVAFAGETIKGSPETINIDTKSSDVRDRNINDDWKFNMTTADCSASTYNDSSWSNVQLPHDFSIYQSFTTSGEAESGFLPGGTGWYRKKITIPASQNDKRFELNFDGAYMHTYVYVNGSYVGENHYGYNSFAFDITDKLTCDGSTENVIAVKVVHNTPSSRWYSGSGIYRDVTLTVTDPVHIAHNGLTITTPNISSGNGTVNAVANVQNDSASSASVSVKASIYEKGSETAVATATSAGTVAANSKSNITITPVVSSPKLWSVDNPNLYEVKIEISVGGNVVDTYTDQFGFRYFAWTRTGGFSLNGTRVQLNGVCMHHDQGALGSAAYYDAMYRQMQSMKNMGVNSIRATHNPYSKDFYKICDELGLLVIEELYDGWVAPKNGNSRDASEYWNTSLTASNTIIGGSTSMKWPEFVTKEVVQRDVNRPSVFAWSLCNEVCQGTSGFNSSTSATIATNLCNYVKSIDTTRTITCGDDNVKAGTTTQAVNQAIVNAGGVIGLNYCDNSQYNSIFNNSSYSSWTFYGSETSSAINSRDRYMGQSSAANIDNNYHLTSFDSSTVSWGKTANDSMYTTLSDSRIAGEYIWTGWDYIGEPTPWNGTSSGSIIGSSRAYPNSSYFGIVDTAGFEKDTYYFYRSQWGDKVGNTTHLVTAWDSDNYMLTNNKVPIVLYSNAYKVEIYRNGTLMGTATRTDRTNTAGVPYHTYSVASNNTACEAVSAGNNGTSLYATFNIAYEAGTLSTKSYDKSGNLISENTIEGRYKVSTPGDVSKIVMTKDKEEILADGSSLAYFTVDLTDANGNRDTMSSKLIKFDITGNGEIMGCDNGDQATTQKFQQSSVLDVNNRTTAQIYGYAGKALCIVRSTKNSGTLTLTASSPSSEFASVSQNVTTLADSSSQTSLENGDINSYTFIRNYTVRKGTAPTFDTTATATKLGDSKVYNGTVNWNAVPLSVYSNAGDYTINGTLTVDGKSFAVTSTLHVVDTVSALQNISTVTYTKHIPTLPGTVKGLLDSGKESGEFEVTWETMTADMFASNKTIVEVNGTADVFGEPMNVKAFVRVEKPSVTVTDITNTVVEYSSDSQNNGFSSLNDNNYTSKAWTNESTKTSTDVSYIQMRWDTVREISTIKLAYFFDEHAVAPEDVDIQASNNGIEFESVGYTGPAEELVSGKLYEYTLDDILTPIAIRIVFTQQGRTVNGNCVALSELKLFENKNSTVDANDTVSLSDIKIDGVSVDGFNSKKTSYPNATVTESTVVTAQTDNNTAITVLPYSNESIRIVAMSEDGETSTIYSLGKNIVLPTPDVTTEAYKFDFKNSTPTTLASKSYSTLTDNNGNSLNYILWQASSVTTGQYMTIQDAFINTPSTIDTGIKGDCWNVVYRYNKTTAEKPNATLIGLGTSGGSGSMADLIYITADGYIETGFSNISSNQSTSVGKSLYNTSASSPETLDIGYDNGIVTVKYNDEVVFAKDISSNDTLNNKFKNGVGSFFIGANKYVNAGGTYSDTSHNSSGQAAYIQKLYDLTGTTTVKGNPGNVSQEAENIAPKATSITSNNGSNTFNKQFLIDGRKFYDSNKTEVDGSLNNVNNWSWRSNGKLEITFTFDKLYDLDYLNLYYWCEGWGTFPPDKLDVYTSQDGSNFGTSVISKTKTSGDIPSQTAGGVYDEQYSFPSNTKAKAIKIVSTVNDTSKATGFAEIEIFNKAIVDETETSIGVSGFEHNNYNSSETFNNNYIDEHINDLKSFNYISSAQVANDSSHPINGNYLSNLLYCSNTFEAGNENEHYKIWARLTAPKTIIGVYDGKNQVGFPILYTANGWGGQSLNSIYINKSDTNFTLRNNLELKHNWYGSQTALSGVSVQDSTQRWIIGEDAQSDYKDAWIGSFTGVLKMVGTGTNYMQNIANTVYFNDNIVSDFNSNNYLHYESSIRMNTVVGNQYSSIGTVGANYKQTKDENTFRTSTVHQYIINAKPYFDTLNSAKNNYNSIVKINGVDGYSCDSYASYSQALKNLISFNIANYIANTTDSNAATQVQNAAENMTRLINEYNQAYDGLVRQYYVEFKANGNTVQKQYFTDTDVIPAKPDDIVVQGNSENGFNHSVLSWNGIVPTTQADKVYNATVIKSEPCYNEAGTINGTNADLICSFCNSHNSVDFTAYISALSVVNDTLSNTNKFKYQSIKNARNYIDENNYSNIITDNKVNRFISQEYINTITADLITLNTALNQRINIKRFDVDYSYQKNKENILKSGYVVDARYGDWLTDSEYALADNESVYKWTIERSNATKQIANTTTHFNALVNSNMSLVCYITDGTEEAPADQNKVTFIDNVGKTGNIEYCCDGTVYRVDANTIVDANGEIVYKAKKPPFYQVKGFRVSGTTYESGDTITVNTDTTIYPVYTADANYKIYTTGSTAANAKINGDAHSNVSGAYSAYWDELITVSNDTALYWYVNGVLSAYGTEFKFRACNDCNITASVNENSNLPTATTSYFNYDTELNKATAVVTFYGAGQDVEEAGVILSTNYSNKQDIIDNGRKFAANRFTEIGNQCKISVTRTANTSFNMYAVSYVVVNGTPYYSNNVSTISYNP